MAIENAIYVSESSYNELRQPLLIACSGGGGHIAAIQGLQQYLHYQYKTINFTEYKPVLSAESPPSPTQVTIQAAISFMHAYAIGTVFQAAIRSTPYPVLPDRISFDKEINSLNESEKRKEQRYYQDMLLDAYPAGYASVAVWNILQRNNQLNDLKKLVNLQAKSDTENYPNVINYFLNNLKAAAIVKTPYTEIISTQAMALPALCDAVLMYNQWLEEKQLPFPKIIIHQYMTDLPTEGAVHFFNPLANLSLKQQKQMKLYAVGLKDDILQRFFPEGYHFSGVYDIPADQNPMVRSGFKDPSLDNSNKFHVPTEITLKWHKETEKQFSVNANELIASIMLGSQAGKDTTEYIETLLKSGFDKVFVFGNNETIIKKIAQINKQGTYAGKEIICLGSQGDKEIAALMTRSNFIIIRGGGLSVMEQLAMKHNPEKAILIHHANADTGKALTSGISWEDGNVDILIKELNQHDIYTQKTSPERAKRQIPETRLLIALKILNLNDNQAQLVIPIKKMREEALKTFLSLLNSTYIKNNSQELLHFLFAYTQINRESPNFENKWLAALNIALRENTLEKKVSNFYEPAKNEAFFNTEACQINSIYIEIKQKLKNYCCHRKESLESNLIRANRKLTSQKISIVNNLLSKLEKVKNQKEGNRLAEDLTQLLLKAQIKNKKITEYSTGSPGTLGKILENALHFLAINYPFSFRKGEADFLTALAKRLEKQEKKSFSLYQAFRRFLKLLVISVLGKNKVHHFTSKPSTANLPVIETRGIDIRGNSTVTTNFNEASIPNRTEAPTIWERQISSNSQVSAGVSFYQAPSDDKTDPKPWQFYCLKR